MFARNYAKTINERKSGQIPVRFAQNNKQKSHNKILPIYRLWSWAHNQERSKQKWKQDSKKGQI